MPCRRVYEGPVEITDARISCPTDDQVRFFTRTQGWTSGVTVFSQETGAAEPQWSDQHDLKTYKFGACGDFDMLQLELQTGLERSPGPDDEAWEANLSTAFSCAQNSDGTWVNHGDPSGGGIMTYLVRAYDVDGTFASCMVFGHDPAGLVSGKYTRVLDPDRPEELENCKVGTYTESKGKEPKK